MHHGLFRFHVHVTRWRYMLSEELLALLLVLFVFIVPASALRLQERSLFIHTNEPSALSSYTVSYRYMSPTPIGSVDLLFCMDPIPYHPCVTPPGLDVSNAVLSDQSGESGFSILSRSANRLVLTRTASGITNAPSSYKFDNIINPSYEAEAFAVRIKTHSSTNATGSQVDFGSIRGQIQTGIEIATQVPPMLIFCLAEEVEENCSSTNDNYYTDMGELNPQTTLTAQSQMAVGTNASGGFAITANGTPPAAGTNLINGLTIPTLSAPGTNQFGINLVENSSPAVGNDPEGTWANAIPSADYSIANRYKYIPGETVAYSPNVSLMKKFTVSYILNSSENLRAGVYSTTITFIASGRF